MAENFSNLLKLGYNFNVCFLCDLVFQAMEVYAEKILKKAMSQILPVEILIFQTGF